MNVFRSTCALDYLGSSAQEACSGRRRQASAEGSQGFPKGAAGLIAGTDLGSPRSASTQVRRDRLVTLPSVEDATRWSAPIQVKYQFLSSPEPRWPRIARQAITFDGFRCHTRASYLNDDYFKDVLLSRILKPRAPCESEGSADADRDLHSEGTLKVGPHTDLTDTQAKVIALDYGMRGGKAKINVGRAFLRYALRRLGLDTDPAARRPHDQQIILLNRGKSINDANLGFARSANV